MTLVAALAAVLTGALVGLPALRAQGIPPQTTVSDDTPPTTEPPTTTPPPAPPPTDPQPTTTTAITVLPPPAPPAPGSPSPAPSTTTLPGGGGGGGGGGAKQSVDPSSGAEGGDSGGAKVVPADARRIINSVKRTRRNDSLALVQGVEQLEAAGVPHDDAVRVAYGQFIVAGPAHWSDDWLNPRWTGSLFRFHLGCDVFAPHGTPVRAPVDGVARVGTSTLGGLAVTVVQPDGTLFYLAHLSDVADGIATGTPVSVGDVVGFVGTSGNARGGAAHVHFAIHPRGGAPVPPKPVLDKWVADAAARLPQLLAQHPPAPARALLATDLTRQLASGATSAAGAAGPRTELLYVSSVNPAGGSLQLADASAAAAASSIDWAGRAREQALSRAVWSRDAAMARRLLAPLTAPVLRLLLSAPG